MYLMFDNAWSYNRKTSRVYRFCTKLSEVFEATINDAMQGLGYCCGYRVRMGFNWSEKGGGVAFIGGLLRGQNQCYWGTTLWRGYCTLGCRRVSLHKWCSLSFLQYTFHPQVLYCYGKPLCTIARDAPYYGYQNRQVLMWWASQELLSWAILSCRYVYCQKCFGEILGDTITVGDDPLTATIIPKLQFKEMKNNSIDREG